MEAMIKELSVLGGAGLMFLAYYILHQSSFGMIKALMETSEQSFSQALHQQTASFDTALRQMGEWSDKLNARQTATDERIFAGMKEQLEALKVLVASASRLEAKIDSISLHHTKGGHKA